MECSENATRLLLYGRRIEYLGNAIHTKPCASKHAYMRVLWAQNASRDGHHVHRSYRPTLCLIHLAILQSRLVQQHPPRSVRPSLQAQLPYQEPEDCAHVYVGPTNLQAPFEKKKIISNKPSVDVSIYIYINIYTFPILSKKSATENGYRVKNKERRRSNCHSSRSEKCTLWST